MGIRSAPFPWRWPRSSPGIFTLNSSGSGQAAVVNENGTVNGPENPAPRGTVVSIYGTGEGQTTPSGWMAAIVDPLRFTAPGLASDGIDWRIRMRRCCMQVPPGTRSPASSR